MLIKQLCQDLLFSQIWNRDLITTSWCPQLTVHHCVQPAYLKTSTHCIFAFLKKTAYQCSHRHDPVAPCRAVDIFLGQGAGEGHSFRASCKPGNVECLLASLCSPCSSCHTDIATMHGCVHVCCSSWCEVMTCSVSSFSVSFLSPLLTQRARHFCSFAPLVVSACFLQILIGLEVKSHSARVGRGDACTFSPSTSWRCDSVCAFSAFSPSTSWRDGACAFNHNFFKAEFQASPSSMARPCFENLKQQTKRNWTCHIGSHLCSQLLGAWGKRIAVSLKTEWAS